MYDKFLIKIIDVHDVMKILNTNDRQARRIIYRMRKRFNKEKPRLLILQDFIDYSGLQVANVVAILGWK